MISSGVPTWTGEVSNIHNNCVAANILRFSEVPIIMTRCSAIAERPRCRVRYTVIVFEKVEDWNWETIFYGHYTSFFNHCDIIGLKICPFRRENAK